MKDFYDIFASIRINNVKKDLIYNKQFNILDLSIRL